MLGASRERSDTETFFSFTSFTAPCAVYRYDVLTDKTTPFRQVSVNFNPEDYVTSLTFVTSKDGTRIPMFITHKCGLKRDGNNPVYLYGYGGFNISITPEFGVAPLVWMEMAVSLP